MNFVPLGPLDRSVYLTADDMTVATEDVSFISIGSDSATATARTFTLAQSLRVGHQLTLCWSTAGFSGQLQSSGTTLLQSGADWQPQQYDMLRLVSDGTNWVELSRSSNGAGLQAQELTGTLTQAQMVALHATPVTLVPAPGAGRLVIVDEIEFVHDYSTAAYTGGGVPQVQYHTSATPVQVFATAVITATASASYTWKPTASYASTSTGGSETDLSTSVAKAVEITNATANFGGGNAANVFKWRVRFHVVSALT